MKLQLITLIQKTHPGQVLKLKVWLKKNYNKKNYFEEKQKIINNFNISNKQGADKYRD